jgi:hypothetical protein
MSEQQGLDLLHGPVEVRAGEQEFHPVAGGKQADLFNMIQARKHLEGVSLIKAHHGELLADFHGRRLVVHAEKYDVTHLRSFDLN